MHNPATCCPSRPAHSRSRAFFQAAATLALIAGGLSGSLSTQAMATDYINPLGNTETGSQQFHDTPAMTFTNLGTINSGSSNVSAMMLYGGQTVTLFTNSGDIINETQIGVNLYTRPADVQLSASVPSLITEMNNSGNIIGAINGLQLGTLTDTIVHLTNTGTISGGILSGPYGGESGINIYGSGIITTIDNSGTIAGKMYGINSSGSIGTINLLNGSTLTGQNNSAINNTGTIGAINLQSGATINGGITNSGVITSITNASSINNITNSGTITTLTNSGTIGTFTNSGAIGSFTNSGTMDIANVSGSIGTVNNTGTINTVNLTTGWSLPGSIVSTGTIRVLNVNITGLTSTNYDILFPNFTGVSPLEKHMFGLPVSSHSVSGTSLDNNRSFSVDTSAFGANTNAIRQVSDSVARLANTNGLIDSIGAKATKHANSPYMLTSDLCADGAVAPAQVGNSDFWVRGFTGRNNVDASASTANYINTYSGGAVGVDRDWSEDVRGGVFIGAGTMKNSLGGGLGGTDTNLLFAGTYATKTWGMTFAKVGLTGGRGSNTGTRNIASVTPEVAKSDYKSWYVSPEVSVGRVYALGQYLGGEVSVTPVLSARYVYASQDGYTETGATSNLTMGSSSSTTVEERAELKFSYTTKAFSDYGLKLNASIGGIGQQNSGGAQNGTLLGTPLSFATPGQTNTTGFVGGLGFEVNRGRYTFSASGDYVRLSGGNADLSANVVFSVKF